jgi:hypothetical protein
MKNIVANARPYGQWREFVDTGSDPERRLNCREDYLNRLLKDLAASEKLLN